MTIPSYLNNVTIAVKVSSASSLKLLESFYFYVFFTHVSPAALVDDKISALGSLTPTDTKPTPKPQTPLMCNCDEEENRERTKTSQLQPAEAEQIIEFENAIQNVIYVR